ncbi:MAG: DNA-directed RNA polymerase subunit P [Thermoplasmata archaeon]
MSRDYRCSRCKEIINIDIKTVGIQCEKCGSKLFYKERPNIKKTIKSI